MPRPRRARRQAGLAAASVAVLAGCAMPLAYEGTPPDELTPPSPIATYRSGTATIALADGSILELEKLAPGAVLYDKDYWGASAVWSSGDGWYLRIDGATETTVLGTTAWLMLDHVIGTQHLTTFNTDRCIIDVTKADTSGLVGTASCKDLVWSDAILVPALPPYDVPSDAETFDAEIAFSAQA